MGAAVELKQQAENAAFDKAFNTSQSRKRYRPRCMWFTRSIPGPKREEVLHRWPWGAPGLMLDAISVELNYLDGCLYHDENGRIQCVSEDGQVFVQQERAKTSRFDFKLSSGATMETTKRGTR